MDMPSRTADDRNSSRPSLSRRPSRSGSLGWWITGQPHCCAARETGHPAFGGGFRIGRIVFASVMTTDKHGGKFRSLAVVKAQNSPLKCGIDDDLSNPIAAKRMKDRISPRVHRLEHADNREVSFLCARILVRKPSRPQIGRLPIIVAVEDGHWLLQNCNRPGMAVSGQLPALSPQQMEHTNCNL